MTNEILVNIRERDNLLGKFKKNNETEYYENYCKLRKETLKLLNNNTFPIKSKIINTILKSSGKASKSLGIKTSLKSLLKLFWNLKVVGVMKIVTSIHFLLKLRQNLLVNSPNTSGAYDVNSE